MGSIVIPQVVRTKRKMLDAPETVVVLGKIFFHPLSLLESQDEQRG